MYKTSTDKRFIKNKKAIQKAYRDLIIEKGTAKLSVAEIAKRADINRMTFYLHYDVVEDIFDEFVDEMKQEIREAIAHESTFSLDAFFRILNEMMYKEIDFFRYIAKHQNLSPFKEAFKSAISELIVVDVDDSYSRSQALILSDLSAVCVAYTYLDWLSGLYGEVSLEEVIAMAKKVLRDMLSYMYYLRWSKGKAYKRFVSLRKGGVWS